MAKLDNNIGGYTTKEAADKVGVTETRIRQLTQGENAIDHKKVLGRLIILPSGIKQAQARNTKIGRKVKLVETVNGGAKLSK